MLIAQLESDRQISESGGVRDGYGDGDNANDDPNNPEAPRNDSDDHGCPCKRDKMGEKVKRLVLFPFLKSKKKKKQTKTTSKLSSLSSSGKRVGSGAGAGFCIGGFCCTRPRTLESPPDSKSSDPNDATFTYDRIKDLIETNRFYSKECNTHLV